LDRANRYHQTKDKNRFIIGRAFLKLILRELTGLDAREINFKYEKNKKPYLPDLWTRKEALVKAMGKGIDDDFPNITVLDGTNQLKSSHSKNTGNWQVFSLDISEEYLAAVAINKISEKPPKVQLYELPKNIDEVFEL